MKTVRVQSACLSAGGAVPVTVEARFEARLEADRARTDVVLSGLPDAVVRESKGRLLCALTEAGLRLPSGRLTLNLVPAGLRKSGAILDLAMALAAVAAVGHLSARDLSGCIALGGLGIDGGLHDVPGALAAARAGCANGAAEVVAPPRMAREAALDPAVRARPFRSLAEVVRWSAGALERAPLPTPAEEHVPTDAARLAAVRGHALAKEALAVAAAGGHALLLVGPPGVGKSLLARALADLLPPLERDERLEITRLASASGAFPDGLLGVRPFRAPHHTTSHAGLVGGGNPPAPGEITRAHRGVLFLDELTEFRRDVLECLRQPLEDGRVRLSRASHEAELPARFQLVCAMNPCPCGYAGHPRRTCPCSPREIARYRSRLSGPFLDRVDLRVELAVPPLQELLAGAPEAAARSEAQALCERVLAARRAALERQGDVPNARLPPGELELRVPLDGRLQSLLVDAAGKRDLSARAVQSVRRVARTLADLDGAQRVGAEHVARALALRQSLA